MVSTNHGQTHSKFDDAVKRLSERMNVTDSENQSSFQSVQKDVEKMKFELTDVIDSKFEYISKNVESQTKSLRSTYDTLSSSLFKTNDELNNNFKEKVVAIKSMVATFFAKVEKQVTESEEKSKGVQQYLSKFEANFVNPAKEIDGKIYAMNMQIQHEEQLRES